MNTRLLHMTVFSMALTILAPTKSFALENSVQNISTPDNGDAVTQVVAALKSCVSKFSNKGNAFRCFVYDRKQENQGILIEDDSLPALTLRFEMDRPNDVVAVFKVYTLTWYAQTPLRASRLASANEALAQFSKSTELQNWLKGLSSP